MARWGLGCLGVLVLLFVGGYGAFKFYEYSFRVAHAPAELEVIGITYAEEEAWGFGPGGNETGVIVYGLSDSIAQKIATQGLAFFYEPSNVARRSGHQRSHDMWLETPVMPDERWNREGGKSPKLAEYLTKYGFALVNLDRSVEAIIDEAISSPGSFYSYGRTGIIIVIPAKRRAAFVYAG